MCVWTAYAVAFSHLLLNDDDSRSNRQMHAIQMQWRPVSSLTLRSLLLLLLLFLSFSVFVSDTFNAKSLPSPGLELHNVSHGDRVERKRLLCQVKRKKKELESRRDVSKCEKRV